MVCLSILSITLLYPVFPPEVGLLLGLRIVREDQPSVGFVPFQFWSV